MLIRLCGHHIDNPNHIDKLICIKGLPDEFFFRVTKHGKELIRPWEPDVEANIPKEIRHLCDPFEITQVFPPIEKGKESVIDKTTVLGLRFNFISEAGETMWERIERYLERSVARDQMIPKPVIVAPNQKSLFDPHEARRSSRGSLELRKAEIPVIDVSRPEPVAPPIITVQAPIVTAAAAPAPAVVVTHEAAPFTFRCEPCGKDFNERGLRMHNMKKHSAVNPVPAGV